jgi:hypothetical protein
MSTLHATFYVLFETVIEMYQIYAESWKGSDRLVRIRQEAREVVVAALRGAVVRDQVAPAA